MKLLIENWREYLNEIGDATSEPYYFGSPESHTDDFFIYNFRTPENNYMVQLSKNPTASHDEKYPEFSGKEHFYWDISYKTIGSGRGDPFGETNEHKLFRVLSTIVAIIKDFIESGRNNGVQKFQFEGTEKKYGEEWITEPRIRTKLYLRYLKKQIPDVEFEEIGKDVIRFIVPEER